MTNEHPLLDFLFSRRRFGLKPGLERITELLDSLGHPERKYRVIHVAGTNGKGTTCAYLESLLRASGLRTGLYTSPHLVHPEERIRVNFDPIPREKLLEIIDRTRPEIERTGATFFEAMTAIGFAYFAEAKVDVAIVEVGLGGRWDATNVVGPEATVITDVHLDHQEHLGRSMAEIAREKAGILKPGVPCFTYTRSRKALAEIRARADEVGAAVFRLQDQAAVRVRRLSPGGTEFDYRSDGWRFTSLRTCLVGRHQALNAGLALLVTEKAEGLPRLNPDLAAGAIAATRWAGRFQVLSDEPIRLLDVAHNSQGVRALVDTFCSVWPGQEDVVIVLGLLRDKPARSILRSLRRLGDTLVVCRLPSLRTADPKEIAAAAGLEGFRVHVRHAPAEAWELGKRLAEDRPLIGAGSHYLVGEILAHEGLH